MAVSCEQRWPACGLRRIAPGALTWLVAAGIPVGPAAAAEPAGIAVFRQHCVRCHGPDGQGTATAPAPLAGDLSVNQLAAIIDETMPEDDPSQVSGDAARAVAAYVHETFYSAVARDRTRPARLELGRLTVRQHRAALADIVGSFRGRGPALDERRGLRAEYFHGRSFDRRQLVFEQIDPLVDFAFGVEGPDPERFEPNRFAIRWTGSLVAPDTGVYEFVVRTEHSARLALNRAWYEPPLIDAWVKSGDETEYRGSLFLLGGRAYPLRLEFSKANQGVDSRKHEPLTTASIALLWRPPHGVLEPVPERCLLPHDAPDTFVAATPFPPDDTSTGYERGTNVSREWFAATTAAAGETAAYVRDHVEHLARVKRDAPDRAVKVRTFAGVFAERAFRRPLPAEVREMLVDRPFSDAPDADTGLERAILGVLKSPRFLFREVGGSADAFDTAARLSFGLWDSIPDQSLHDAAAAGRLGTPAEVRRQAERMLQDRRTRAKVRDVLHAWLKLAPAPDIAKDPSVHPDFTAAVAADLRTSFDLFLDDVVWREGDWRRLFTAADVPVNPRLAVLYAAAVAPESFRSAGHFRGVALDGGRRAGVLSHPYLMSALAHPGTTSPIHRGVFVARTILGNVLKPPQEAIAPLAPDQHPGLTTRQRVTLQTSPVGCRTCHTMINPLGFALEEFDAIGRHRAVERTDDGEDQPLDLSGSYQARQGGAVTFHGVRELGAFLAGSDDATEAFVQSMFQGMIKQPVRAWGPGALDRLCRSFRESGHDIRRLLVDMMEISVFPPTADLTQRLTSQLHAGLTAAGRTPAGRTPVGRTPVGLVPSGPVRTGTSKGDQVKP